MFFIGQQRLIHYTRFISLQVYIKNSQEKITDSNLQNIRTTERTWTTQPSDRIQDLLDVLCPGSGIVVSSDLISLAKIT